ncbi:hypothetical protein CRUP_018436 [Coryphaenoides rupestris]|nr:hypothetical protein CRUP_018436 [Coryphaenoides rupestris]
MTQPTSAQSGRAGNGNPISRPATLPKADTQRGHGEEDEEEEEEEEERDSGLNSMLPSFSTAATSSSTDCTSSSMKPTICMAFWEGGGGGAKLPTTTNDIPLPGLRPNQNGILAMLDEECLRPGTVTDSTFLDKLNTVCAEHQHFESRLSKNSKFLTDHSLPHSCFRIQHYAGKVLYRVEGFMDKNNNLLYRDLSQAMYKANHSLIKQLFPEGNPAKVNLKRPPTAGFQFKASVGTLMKNLQTKNPNYIRCVKPNDKKASHIFTESLVRHQVAYLGLMENVRVRRAGYAYRQAYEPCLERYKMLCKQTWPHWRGPTREGVEVLMADLQVPTEEFAYGRSKIFIRNPRTQSALRAV